MVYWCRNVIHRRWRSYWSAWSGKKVPQIRGDECCKLLASASIPNLADKRAHGALNNAFNIVTIDVAAVALRKHGEQLCLDGMYFCFEFCLKVVGNVVGLDVVVEQVLLCYVLNVPIKVASVDCYHVNVIAYAAAKQ